jgi:adenylate kinase
VRLLLLGAPGSGKGTQAERLAEHFQVAHLSTGELLRAEVSAGTPLGTAVEGYLAAGDLVPDELVEPLIMEKLVFATTQGGWVLDGFPRTLHQALAAHEIARQGAATVDAVVLLDVPRDELVRRLLTRGQGRSDDAEVTVRHRLEVYESQTTPLIGYYRDRGVLAVVPGLGAPEQVFADILARVTTDR